MGVLAGSVTLTGGPATGLAFAPLFEKAGVPGAATLAVAAAMVGIVAGGLMGGPIGTFLIERGRLAGAQGAGRRRRRPRTRHRRARRSRTDAGAGRAAPAGEDVEAYGLLKTLVIILVAMWIGAWVSRGFAALASRCRPTSARCWSPR